MQAVSNCCCWRLQRRGVTPGGRRASENEKAGSLQHFLCGLMAGTLAKLGTHPLDVCKKRFQVRQGSGYQGVVEPSQARTGREALAGDVRAALSTSALHASTADIA